MKFYLAEIVLALGYLHEYVASFTSSTLIVSLQLSFSFCFICVPFSISWVASCEGGYSTQLGLFFFHAISFSKQSSCWFRYGIVHRSLRPESVLFSASGHVRLVGFDFAKRVEDRTFTFCGAPDYVAPEMLNDRGYAQSVDW